MRRPLRTGPDGQVIQEASPEGNGVLQYIWSSVGGLHLIARDQNADSDWNDDTAGLPKGIDLRVYALADHTNSITALVSTAGQVIRRYSYGPDGTDVRVRHDYSMANTEALGGSQWVYTYRGARVETRLSGNMEFYYLNGQVWDSVKGGFLLPDALVYHGQRTTARPEPLPWWQLSPGAENQPVKGAAKTSH